MTIETEARPSIKTAPLCLFQSAVKPEFIDYNGHMNVAYYVLLFDEATDAYKNHVGLTTDYRQQTGCSTFAAELHVCYLKELALNDKVRVETLLLDCDDKRHHFIHSMYKVSDENRGGENGAGKNNAKKSGAKESDAKTNDDRANGNECCATMEVMSMHVDLSARKVTPFPDAIARSIRELTDQHAHLPRPAQTGAVIGIRRKT